MHFFFPSLIFLFNISSIVSLIELFPIKCPGFLEMGKDKLFPAVFLSKSKLEVLENSNLGGSNEIILCDVIPFQIGQYENLVYSEMRQVDTTLDTRTGCINFVNRDKGLFDNLPYEWGKGTNNRKEIFNFMNGGQADNSVGGIIRLTEVIRNVRSPYLCFCLAMKHMIGAEVVGLILELTDESSDSIKLGAAAVIARGEETDKWRLTIENSKIPAFKDINDRKLAPACVVNCHIDEAIGLALALNMPIFTTNKIFLNSIIDAKLVRDQRSAVCSIYATNPSIRQSDSKANNAESILPAWEIFNPQKFLTMSTLEKRAVLRASNVKELPRPREGNEALDAALLDLADDAVRGEVYRLRSLSMSSKDTSTKMTNSNDISDDSSRQSLLRRIGEALESGKLEVAEKLRDDFVAKTALRADPTQPEGSYSRFLDQDDWYLAARRKAMGNKK